MRYHPAMQHSVLAVWFFFFAAGCLAESRGPAYDVKTAASEPTVCTDEQPTGSTITRRVCRSPEQRADDAAAKQSWMNHASPNPLRGDSTYPGVDARHARE